MKNIPLDNADQPEFEDASKISNFLAEKLGIPDFVFKETRWENFSQRDKDMILSYAGKNVRHEEYDMIVKIDQEKPFAMVYGNDIYAQFKNVAGMGEMVKIYTHKTMQWAKTEEEPTVVWKPTKSSIKKQIETLIKTDSMPENKVILETPAGKYVPLELLERTLSEWNGRRKKPLTNDMLFQIFRNEFPELNLQVVGHEVKAV